MQALLSLSIALFAGLMLSRLAKIAKLPAVTAYLVAGILVGPYLLGSFGIPGLGFISMEDIEAYSILTDVALGFIAFSIGNEFRLGQLKKTGKQATVIGIFQAVVTTLLVDAVLIGSDNFYHFSLFDKFICHALHKVCFAYTSCTCKINQIFCRICIAPLFHFAVNRGKVSTCFG